MSAAPANVTITAQIRMPSGPSAPIPVRARTAIPVHTAIAPATARQAGRGAAAPALAFCSKRLKIGMKIDRIAPRITIQSGRDAHQLQVPG